MVGILYLDKKKTETLEQCLIGWRLLLNRQTKNLALPHGDGTVEARGETRRPVG